MEVTELGAIKIIMRFLDSIGGMMLTYAMTLI